jgi:hypothetical protein
LQPRDLKHSAVLAMPRDDEDEDWVPNHRIYERTTLGKLVANNHRLLFDALSEKEFMSWFGKLWPGSLGQGRNWPMMVATRRKARKHGIDLCHIALRAKELHPDLEYPVAYCAKAVSQEVERILTKAKTRTVDDEEC